MARIWARMFAERVTGTTAGDIWLPAKYQYKGPISTIAAGTVGAHYILPDIEDGPGLNMVANEVPWTISSFGSYGGVRLAGSEVQVVGGNFSTALFSENAEWLIRHALVSYKLRGGQPFYAGDTFSFSVAKSFVDADEMPQHELYKGCKFSDVTLACSDQSPVLRANFGIVGSTKQYLAGGLTDPYTGDALNYCNPPTDCDAYPSDIYTFQDMELKLGPDGETADVHVTEFRNLALSFRNMIDPIFGQSRNVQSLQRTMSDLSWQAEFTMTLLGDNTTSDLKPVAGDGDNMRDSQWLRYKFEQLRNGLAAASFPIQFKFISNDGTKYMLIKIGRSMITSLQDVMPISRTFTVRAGGSAMLDGDCNNFTIEFGDVV